MSVYNSDGVLVNKLVDEKMKAGVYSLELYADALPNEIYFICLVAEKKREVIRVVVVK